MAFYRKKLNTIRQKYAGQYIFLFLAVFFCTVVWDREFFEPIAWVMFGLLGLDVVFFGVTELLYTHSSRNWHITSAKIISAEAVHRNYQGTVKKYFLELRYEYTAQGKTYESDNYNWIGLVYSRKERVDKLISELKGRPLNVHYNPKDPADAVILPGARLLHYVGPVVGTGMVVASVIGFMNEWQWLLDLFPESSGH